MITKHQVIPEEKREEEKRGIISIEFQTVKQKINMTSVSKTYENKQEQNKKLLHISF